jgi:hypothetical protein
MSNEFIKTIQNRFLNHHHQTEGFTWNYNKATDDDVLSTTTVFPDTIQGLSDQILKSIVPKQRPQLRKDITYLIGLQERQKQAWDNYLADCNSRIKNTEKWLSSQ